MNNGKNDTRQKLKASHRHSMAACSRLIEARQYLVEALSRDETLEQFKIQLQDGHVLTLEDLHTWLIAVIEHYEKNGPKAEAVKVLHEFLRTQCQPDRQ
jgi:hypothetical protein